MNALAGVGKPTAMITATWELLYELPTGRTDADYNRVVSLLARWIPQVSIFSEDRPESET